MKLISSFCCQMTNPVHAYIYREEHLVEMKLKTYPHESIVEHEAQHSRGDGLVRGIMLLHLLEHNRLHILARLVVEIILQGT